MDSRFVADEIPVLWNITSRLNENKTNQHMHTAFDIISIWSSVKQGLIAQTEEMIVWKKIDFTDTQF